MTDIPRSQTTPFPDRDARIPVPDTSMLPGSEKAPPPVVKLLNQAVQGAHDTIDRLADSAAPKVHQWADGVSAADRALHAKSEQWRATSDEWAETLRATVRRKPLASLATAVALGALLARMAR